MANVAFYTATRKLTPTPSGYPTKFIDPWLEVCECCPLPDCIRLEGDLSPYSNGSRRYPGCAIWEGKERGWEPQEVLENAGELGLRDPIEWGEL